MGLAKLSERKCVKCREQSEVLCCARLAYKRLCRAALCKKCAMTVEREFGNEHYCPNHVYDYNNARNWKVYGELSMNLERIAKFSEVPADVWDGLARDHYFQSEAGDVACTKFRVTLDKVMEVLMRIRRADPRQQAKLPVSKLKIVPKTTKPS